MRFVFLILMLLMPLSAHATDPTVAFVPTCAGDPSGFELRMTTGPNASGGITSPCEDGSGDEICGLYLELVPSGGAILNDFTPGDALTRVDAGTFSSSGRIVRINPAGDFGTVSLGCLDMSGIVGSTVSFGASSEAVDARLQGINVQVTPLPEPGAAVAMLAGSALLAHLARRRRVAASLGMLIAVAFSAPADAQIYLDREGFENAIGAGFQLEDFQAIPVDANGNAAFSNGDSIGAFTWTSTSLPSDITLTKPSGSTGLQGTLLVSDIAGTPLQGSPGGDGFPGEAQAEDSFVLAFPSPVEAAGLRIIGNSPQAGEVVEFYDDSSQRLASTPLPADGYVGYIAAPGQNPIAEIRVDESDIGGDDIEFDDVIWQENVAPEVSPVTTAPRVQLESWSYLGYPNLPLTTADDFSGGAVGIGDVDDDGVPDLAFGASGDDDGNPNAGAVYIAFMEPGGTIRNLRKISDTAGGLTGPGNPGGLLNNDERFGRALAAPGDLDGDGIEDLIVGTSNAFERIYVLFLRENGSVRSYQRISETEGGFGGSLGSNDQFGGALASIGDVDGDGVVDLAVGAQTTSDGSVAAGAVWILFMNSDGTVESEQKISATAGSFGSGLGFLDFFGSSVAGIGDLNEDGVLDIAVGAVGDDDQFSDAGAVWILFLETDGTVASRQKISATQGDLNGAFSNFFVSQVLDGGDRFGESLAWIPTPSAATAGVLAVSASGIESQSYVNGAFVTSGYGGVFFLALDTDGTVESETGISRTPVPSYLQNVPGVFDPTLGESSFGTVGLNVVALAGDIDDNGRPELFVGVPQATPEDPPGSGNPVGTADRGGQGFLLTLAGLDQTGFADALVGGGSTGVLGPPDDVGVAVNGTFTVQFLDNVAFGDGSTSSADLALHRKILDDPQNFEVAAEIRVEASADGASWIEVQPLTVYPPTLGVFGNDCGSFPLPPCDQNDLVLIDVDAEGFGPGSPIRFLRIQHTYTCPNPLVDCSPFSPRLDAIQAYTNASAILDSDFDGIPDGFDNCRSFHNPSQQDADSDGVGDFCDNCPDFGNPDQSPVCNESALRLTPATGSGVGLQWRLDLECGSDPIEFINVGIIAPTGTDPDTLVFGLDPANNPTECTPPAASQLVPALAPLASVGCDLSSPNPYVNDVLEDVNSGVIDPFNNPGLFSREDTLYLLFGFPTGPELCSGNHEDVTLGFVSVADPGIPIGDPVFTTQGIDVFTSEDPWGFAAGVNGQGDPAITLSLTPALGGDPDQYEVCMVSDRNINRLTLAIDTPTGAGTGDVVWQGCSTVTGGGQNERSCGSGVHPNVNAANSRTWGPSPGDPRMFVQLEGNTPVGFDLIPALNDAANEVVCLGVIDVTGTSFVPTLSANEIDTVAVQPPIRVAEDLFPFDGTPDTFALPSCAEATTGQACVTTESSFNAPDDFDNDGIRDESDNCEFVQNASQSNAGGLLTTDPALDGTGLGDACQCGDADDSGRMLTSESDVDLIADHLLGLSVDPDVVDRCSVSRGPACDIVDAARLEAGLAGNTVFIEPACTPALAP